MNCKQINNKLIFYIEKSLSSEDMQQVNYHLNRCDSCKNISVLLSSSLNIINKEKRVEVNPFMHTRVLQALENRKNQTGLAFNAMFKRVLQPMLYSAILVVGIGFGISMGNMATKSPYNTYANADMDELFLNDFNEEPIEFFLLNE